MRSCDAQIGHIAHSRVRLGGAEIEKKSKDSPVIYLFIFFALLDKKQNFLMGYLGPRESLEGERRVGSSSCEDDA